MLEPEFLLVLHIVLIMLIPSGPPAVPQKEGSEKPVSDQWLDPFVIVDEEGKPVGTIEDGEHSLSFPGYYILGGSGLLLQR